MSITATVAMIPFLGLTQVTPEQQRKLTTYYAVTAELKGIFGAHPFEERDAFLKSVHQLPVLTRRAYAHSYENMRRELRGIFGADPFEDKDQFMDNVRRLTGPNQERDRRAAEACERANQYMQELDQSNASLAQERTKTAWLAKDHERLTESSRSLIAQGNSTSQKEKVLLGATALLTIALVASLAKQGAQLPTRMPKKMPGTLLPPQPAPEAAPIDRHASEQQLLKRLEQVHIL